MERHTSGARTRAGSPSGRNPSTTTSRRPSRILDINYNHYMRDAFAQPPHIAPARSLQVPSAPASTHQISTSFPTDCLESGHPTTAYSAVTASTPMNHPGPLTSHPVNRSFTSPSRSYANMGAIRVGGGMKTSQTYSNLPMPASLYITPSSKPSVVTAHTTARAIPGRNSENIPPSVSMANIGATKQSASDYATRLQPPQPLLSKKKEKSRLGIPKTRTLNVFSNLTASLSRASLGQLASGDLRRTSGSSKGTAHKDSMPYMNSQSAASTSSSQVLLSPTAEATDQQQIHTAQSSAYWTGRFMALQDHFQSETLRPENLTTLVHAHAERSLLPVAQPSNLTSSATTSCLPQAAKPLTTISMSPPKVQQQPKHQQQQQQQQQQRIPRVGTTAYKASRPMTTAAPARPSYEAAAALLLDEDSRARRIFSHLDLLCTTSDARNSLRRWQQDYARRVGKESLLPEGGTMRGRNRELTWVGRLLIGSSGHSKRGSLGL